MLSAVLTHASLTNVFVICLRCNSHAEIFNLTRLQRRPKMANRLHQAQALAAQMLAEHVPRRKMDPALDREMGMTSKQTMDMPLNHQAPAEA